MTETQSKSIMAFDFGTQKWEWRLASLQLKVPIPPSICDERWYSKLGSALKNRERMAT